MGVGAGWLQLGGSQQGPPHRAGLKAASAPKAGTKANASRGRALANDGVKWVLVLPPEQLNMGRWKAPWSCCLGCCPAKPQLGKKKGE